MNPPYAFNGSRGGGEAWRIWQWLVRDSTQGMAKIWEIIRQQNTAANWQGLAGT